MTKCINIIMFIDVAHVSFGWPISKIGSTRANVFFVSNLLINLLPNLLPLVLLIILMNEVEDLLKILKKY